MDDRLEIAPRCGDRQRRSARASARSTAAVRRQHVRAEPRGDRRGRFGPGRHHAVRERVGVEARHAAAAELVEHVALAGRDAAGQRNFQHDRLRRHPVLSRACSRSLRRAAACSSAASRSSAVRRRRAPASARRPLRSTAGCTSPTTSDAAALERLATLRARRERARSTIARSLDRRRADVDDRRARLDEVGVTNAGRPIAATRMSASRATRGRSAVREWQIVTVAWRCSSSSAIGLPTMSLRPMTTACAPAIGDVRPLEQLDDAGRRARRRAPRGSAPAGRR